MIDEVLYSMSKHHRQGVMGVAKQVYDMDDPVESAIKTIYTGNTTAISSTDVSDTFLHIHTRRVYNHLQGDHVEIVGNASVFQGNFCMVKIPFQGRDKADI